MKDKFPLFDAAAVAAEITGAMEARGFEWHPYSPGFASRAEPVELHAVRSEREVFEFVGLNYLSPQER